jgi:hypothetical protein
VSGQPAIVTAALNYLEHGIQPVLLKPQGKTPVLSEWQKQQITKTNVVQLFANSFNIGIRYGLASGGLTDVEFDSMRARQLAPAFMPKTLAIFGRKSKPMSHWLYLCLALHNGEFGASISIKDADGKEMVSIRIGGGDKGSQSMAPPSIHPSGELVEWIKDYVLTPPSVGLELVTAARHCCVAALLADHWPGGGSRHAFAMAVAGWLGMQEVPQEQTELIVQQAAEAAGDDEVKDRINAVRGSYRALERGEPVTGWTTLSQLIDGKAAKALRAALAVKSRFPDLTKDGGVKATLPNAKVALGLLDIECRYDLFRMQYLTEGHTLNEFVGGVNDPALFRIREMIYDKFRIDIKTDIVYEAVRTVANHHRFHPVCDYLNGLRWDGVKRIDNWLTIYGGAEDNEYTRAVGALVLTAACRRVRQPGCKFDEMLVLEGVQGDNKSTALQLLAIDTDWFSDNLTLGLNPRETIEALSGRWIVEVGELQGMSQADVDKLKAFLSRTTDRARRVWDRTVTDALRQCVIIATTNLDQYLRDLTGNRRIWPVKVGRFDVEALQHDRDQLWAEAAAREASGASIQLPEELWPVAAEEQSARLTSNPFTEILDQTLRVPYGMKGEPMVGKIRTEELWTILNIPPGQRTQIHNTNLGGAMKDLGWEKKHLQAGHGRRAYFYVRGEGPWQTIVVDARRMEEGVLVPAFASYGLPEI